MLAHLPQLEGGLGDGLHLRYKRGEEREAGELSRGGEARVDSATACT